MADGGGGICMPCLLGDYCPNGTVNSRASSGQVLCPDGEVCTPDLEGFNVEDGWTLRYTTKPCPEGTLCPAGTSEASLALGVGDCQACSLTSPVLPGYPSHPLTHRYAVHAACNAAFIYVAWCVKSPVVWLKAKPFSQTPVCVRRS